MNYYNENDPFCSAWLDELICAGVIANGIVDPRNIKEVESKDLDGFKQCHFFAGIGVWSYALKLSGWPDDKPVWTGSCPCQPFSAAGKRNGFKDERHLWPEWFRLIREHGPHTIFGEQVGSALSWLDLVSRDLESEGYAIGSAIIGAHSVGAPHVRQRIYWVADSESQLDRRRIARTRWRTKSTNCGDIDGMAVSTESRRPDARQYKCRSSQLPARPAKHGELGNTSKSRLAERPGEENRQTTIWNKRKTAAASSHWNDCDWLQCIDGKARPVEPGTFPLAHGVTNRVGRLRGYGNALVAQQAEAFIRAYMACHT